MTLSSPKYQVLSKSLNHVIISRSRSVDNPDHLYLISRTVNETFHPAPVNSTMKLGDVSLSHGSDMALSECDIWADHQWFFSRYFGFLHPVYNVFACLCMCFYEDAFDTCPRKSFCGPVYM